MRAVFLIQYFTHWSVSLNFSGGFDMAVLGRFLCAGYAIPYPHIFDAIPVPFRPGMAHSRAHFFHH